MRFLPHERRKPFTVHQRQRRAKKRDDGVANTDGRSPTLLCASLYDARQYFDRKVKKYIPKPPDRHHHHTPAGARQATSAPPGATRLGRRPPHPLPHLTFPVAAITYQRGRCQRKREREGRREGEGEHIDVAIVEEMAAVTSSASATIVGSGTYATGYWRSGSIWSSTAARSSGLHRGPGAPASTAARWSGLCCGPGASASGAGQELRPPPSAPPRPDPAPPPSDLGGRVPLDLGGRAPSGVPTSRHGQELRPPSWPREEGR
jgi:hypothetical protein